MALQEESAAAEVLPLRRADLDDVLAVADRRLADERNRVQAAAGFRDLESITGEQRGIVAERFHEVPGADIPAAAERRVDVEMQLLVLNPAAVNEVLILPDAVDDDVAGQTLEERARLAVRRVARVDIGVHDARAPEEAAGSAELIGDPGEDAAQTPYPMLNRKLREPERRRRRHAAGARATARELEIQPVDLFEDEPAVDVGHAIVVRAFDAVGIRQPDAGPMAQAALRAHDVEDRIVAAARRGELLIDRRQDADVRAVRVARELDRRDRLHDPPGVDQVLRDLEQLAAFEKERPLLGEKQRQARIERELAGVRFHL